MCVSGYVTGKQARLAAKSADEEKHKYVGYNGNGNYKDSPLVKNPKKIEKKEDKRENGCSRGEDGSARPASEKRG